VRLATILSTPQQLLGILFYSDAALLIPELLLKMTLLLSHCMLHDAALLYAETNVHYW
jgi:hypothetical protein